MEQGEAETNTTPPQPVLVDTAPTIVYTSGSSRVGNECGETCGQDPLDHIGATLDGVGGWDEAADNG